MVETSSCSHGQNSAHSGIISSLSPHCLLIISLTIPHSPLLSLSYLWTGWPIVGMLVMEKPLTTTTRKTMIWTMSCIFSPTDEGVNMIKSITTPGQPLPPQHKRSFGPPIRPLRWWQNLQLCDQRLHRVNLRWQKR